MRISLVAISLAALSLGTASAEAQIQSTNPSPSTTKLMQQINEQSKKDNQADKAEAARRAAQSRRTVTVDQKIDRINAGTQQSNQKNEAAQRGATQEMTRALSTGASAATTSRFGNKSPPVSVNDTTSLSASTKQQNSTNAKVGDQLSIASARAKPVTKLGVHRTSADKPATMGGTSLQTQKLQMAMDRRAKASVALSNMSKKLSTTNAAVTRNMR